MSILILDDNWLMKDETFVDKIVMEYDTIMDTMDGVHFNFYSYIPSYYDLVGAIPDESIYTLADIQIVLSAMHYFYRDKTVYINKPIREVW